MKSKTVQTTNVKALMSAAEYLSRRVPGSPGMAMIHGSAGYGKTTAVRWFATQYDAIYVTALPTHTPTWLLGDLCEEIGGRRQTRCQPMWGFLVRELKRGVQPKPIVIDEADNIATNNILTETLRSLHDLTGAPILLVGMAEFKQRAIHRPQLYRRIVREVEFCAATASDARMIADELCEVPIADDLVAALHQKAGGSVGLLINELSNAEGFVRRHSIKKPLATADYAVH